MEKYSSQGSFFLIGVRFRSHKDLFGSREAAQVTCKENTSALFDNLGSQELGTYLRGPSNHCSFSYVAGTDASSHHKHPLALQCCCLAQVTRVHDLDWRVILAGYLKRKNEQRKIEKKKRLKNDSPKQFSLYMYVNFFHNTCTTRHFIFHLKRLC